MQQPGTMSDMSPSEREKIMQAAGSCNFLLIFLFATTAMALSFSSTGLCSFVSRNVVVDEVAAEIYCNTTLEAAQCNSFFDNHGVGFWGWGKYGLLVVNW